jgi:hypothetical protein
LVKLEKKIKVILRIDLFRDEGNTALMINLRELLPLSLKTKGVA